VYTAPSAPPRNFSQSNPSPTSLLLTWEPPSDEHQNGIISEYHLHVIELLSGREWNWILNTNRYLVEMLHPFYEYTCSVAAFTNALGPSTTISVQQPEDGTLRLTLISIVYCVLLCIYIVPGSPGSLSVNHTSPYTSILEWSPVPSALQNGVIKSHVVQAVSSSSNQAHTVGPHVYTFEFRDLESYTVYNFSVSAATVAGVGHPISHTTRTPVGGTHT